MASDLHPDHDGLIRQAEAKIRDIPRDLEESLRIKIDFVRVDTRNFANLGVEIFPVERAPKP